MAESSNLIHVYTGVLAQSLQQFERGIFSSEAVKRFVPGVK